LERPHDNLQERRPPSRQAPMGDLPGWGSTPVGAPVTRREAPRGAPTDRQGEWGSPLHAPSRGWPEPATAGWADERGPTRVETPRASGSPSYPPQRDAPPPEPRGGSGGRQDEWGTPCKPSSMGGPEPVPSGWDDEWGSGRVDAPQRSPDFPGSAKKPTGQEELHWGSNPPASTHPTDINTRGRHLFVKCLQVYVAQEKSLLFLGNRRQANILTRKRSHLFRHLRKVLHT